MMLLAEITDAALSGVLTGGAGGGSIIVYLLVKELIAKHNGNDSGKSRNKIERAREDEREKVHQEAWRDATTKSLESIEVGSETQIEILKNIDSGIRCLNGKTERSGG